MLRPSPNHSTLSDDDDDDDNDDYIQQVTASRNVQISRC